MIVNKKYNFVFDFSFSYRLTYLAYSSSPKLQLVIVWYTLRYCIKTTLNSIRIYKTLSSARFYVFFQQQIVFQGMVFMVVAWTRHVLEKCVKTGQIWSQYLQMDRRMSYWISLIFPMRLMKIWRISAGTWFMMIFCKEGFYASSNGIHFTFYSHIVLCFASFFIN